MKTYTISDFIHFLDTYRQDNHSLIVSSSARAKEQLIDLMIRDLKEIEIQENVSD